MTMTKTYSCPTCGHDVPLANINVVKDILLCPSCGEVSSFSDVVDAIDDQRHEDDVCSRLSFAPPKHLKIAYDPLDPSGRIVLTQRKFSKSALFLVPFTCVWAGGSLSMIYGSQILSGTFDWKLSLFGMPFLFGSLFLIAFTLFACGLGRHELTLERGKGRFFWGIGPFGFWRKFNYDGQTKISRGGTSYQANRRPLPELHLTYPDRSDKVRICAGMDEDSLDYVEAVLKREARRV